jgi:MOSC domain-containing protein YiiM
MGYLKGIAYKSASRAPMITIEESFVGYSIGVQGDIRGKPGKRQLTILSEEDFSEACQQLGQTLPWTIRRANLLVSGIQLQQATGKHLRIGDLLVEITGETEPCYRMDEQHEGLKDALTPLWRGGVTAKVITEANIKTGDPVSWL